MMSGAPTIEISVVSKSLTSAKSPFASWAATRAAASRGKGSGTSVGRRDTENTTWLFNFASPGARNEAGTPATSGASGSALCSMR